MYGILKGGVHSNVPPEQLEWTKCGNSLIPRLSPTSLCWCILGFSNDGNVSMHKIAVDWKWYKTARLLFQFTYLKHRRQQLKHQPSSDVVVWCYYNWIQDFDWPLAQLIFNLALSPGPLELCYLSCILDVTFEPSKRAGTTPNVFKLQDRLDRDVRELSFSNCGNVPTCDLKLMRSSWTNSTSFKWVSVGFYDTIVDC